MGWDNPPLPLPMRLCQTPEALFSPEKAMIGRIYSYQYSVLEDVNLGNAVLIFTELFLKQRPLLPYFSCILILLSHHLKPDLI
jgi:hypothetical protein